MDEALFTAAAGVRARAHAPYSRFAVGAALRAGDGSIHVGANVENASYPEGWCAETSALGAMIAAGGSAAARRVSAICVVADAIDGRLSTPCGGCRQRLAEFAGPDTPVFLATPSGRGAEYRLGDLLPAGFALDGHR